MSYSYRSWQHQDKNFDDNSYEDPYTASPPTYTSDPYGFDLATDEPSPPITKNKSGISGKGSRNTTTNKKKKGSTSDIYDYDLSNDEFTSPPPKSSKFGNKSQPVRRMSTDDRINEILEKSKIKKPITEPDPDDGNEEEDAYNSWKSSWNQLIEGVGASPSELLESHENISPVKESKPQERKKHSNLDTSDSFEISEGDFEV